MKPLLQQDQRLLNGGMVWAALMWRDTPEAFELLAGPDAPIRRWPHIDGETHEMTEQRAESELAKAIADLLWKAQVQTARERRGLARGQGWL